MDDLTASLRTADSARMVEIIRRRRSELSPETVRQALRNSYADARVIEELLEDGRLRKHYAVRRAVAAHPRAPQPRAAGQGLLPRLLEETDLAVIGAVLENPRMTEPILARLVNNPAAHPGVLRRVAEDRRWGNRYDTRVALCRNPATPVDLTTSLLPSLTRRDRRAVASDPRVPEAVRDRAAALSDC
mgnify:CR=1 FL=1